MAADYFPLRSGTRWTYRHTSTEFHGVEECEIEILDVEDKDGERRARAQVSRKRAGKQQPMETIHFSRTPEGIFSDGGVLPMKRKEFPTPPVVGKTWYEDPNESKLTSLEESIETPAGRFDGCLRVDMHLAGGDAGTARRWYADGVGLVMEEFAAEAWGATVELIGMRRPA